MSHGSDPNLYKFWQYRHALEHRMPLSVDFVELYSAFEPRPESIEVHGKAVGVRAYIGSRPIHPDWQFGDLYDTTVSTYQHYLNLLERLNKLPIFKRPI